jgi:hypothetical protein
MADCRANTEKINSRRRLILKPKLDPERSLWPSFSFCEEINALKRQLKHEKIASSQKRKTESIFSTEINLTISSDEDTSENKEYIFTSSKPFSTSKTKLAKSSHPTNNHYVASE